MQYYNLPPWERRFPSQLEKCRAFLHELDCAAQNQIYNWEGRLKQNQSGVLLLLHRYERLFRQMFLFYAKPIFADQEVPNVDVPSSLIRMSEHDYLRLARHFSITPDLLSESEVASIFKQCALSNIDELHTYKLASPHDRPAKLLMVFPDFKQSFARLAMKSNPNFPSLDSHSFIAGDKSFDPSTVITSQFLHFLEISDLTEWDLVVRMTEFAATDRERVIGSPIAHQKVDFDDNAILRKNTWKIERIFEFFSGSADSSSSFDGLQWRMDIHDFRAFLHDFKVVPTLLTRLQGDQIFDEYLSTTKMTNLSAEDFIQVLLILSKKVPKPSSSIANEISDLATLIAYLRLRSLKVSDLKDKVREKAQKLGEVIADPSAAMGATDGSRPKAIRWELESEEPLAMQGDGNATFAWITPDAVARNLHPRILKRCHDEGFNVLKQHKIHLQRAQAESFYCDLLGTDEFEKLVDNLSGGPAIALVLTQDAYRDTLVEDWKILCGPSDPKIARDIAPNSLRALFGTDFDSPAVYASDSPAAARRHIQLVFGRFMAPYQESLALIKPDIVQDTPTLNNILQRLQSEGFEILNQEEIVLDSEQARELFSGCVDSLDDEVQIICSGPCVALRLGKLGAIDALLSLAGPGDPAEAKLLASSSLRALYGVDMWRNVLHVSTSEGNAERELDLVFNHYSQELETTLGLLLPEVIANGFGGEIMDMIRENGFEIVMEEEMKLGEKAILQLYPALQGMSHMARMVRSLTEEPIMALGLRKRHAIEVCSFPFSLPFRQYEPGASQMSVS